MKNSLSILFAVFLTSSFLVAQVVKPSLPLNNRLDNAAVHTELQTLEKTGVAGVDFKTTDWATRVTKKFSRAHSSPEIQALKAAGMQEKLQSKSNTEETEIKSASTLLPQIGTNFEANWSLVGTPPDNTMAISNQGLIVTANNDGVEYYNENGTMTFFTFWPGFFNDPSLTSTIYDPKVLYDSGSDRFILVVLHGTNSSTSRVLVCFSQTNNPNDGWWVYTLSGNPLNNNCWFDYPKIGISNNDLFVSGNLFNNNDSFNQAVVYQISKAPGLQGNNIQFITWNNFSSNPFAAFTMVPVSYGHQGNYGPGIYLVSSNSGGGSVIRLWDITNDLGANPQITTSPVTVPAYAPAANAQQQGSQDELDNGDCRIQSGFFLDGIIHYVFHCNVGQNWNGINYNRLNVSTLANQTNRFGQIGTSDFSYPAVASFANSVNDRNVMIAFLRSGSSIFPEVRVVNCDENMQFSQATLVKAGTAFVNILQGSVERWGDYSGISRRHNAANPNVWLAGCFGANIPGQANNTYVTWVAEVFSNDVVSTNNLNENSKDIGFVFPNPAYDLIHVPFEAPGGEEVTVDIYDINGKLVKMLYRDTPKKGYHELSFNKLALESGVYFLNIKTSTTSIKNEKLIIHRP